MEIGGRRLQHEGDVARQHALRSLDDQDAEAAPGREREARRLVVGMEYGVRMHGVHSRIASSRHNGLGHLDELTIVVGASI